MFIRLIKLCLLLSVLSLGLLSLGGCVKNGELLDGLEQITGQAASGGVLSTADIANGLKQALSVSSNEVVAQLGQQNGFYADPQIKIPLPTALVRAREVAAKVGMSKYFDSLELKINQAAEDATPKAKRLFVGAIKQMTLSDAKGILYGSEDAATQFFKRTMGGQLSDAMRPIINNSLSQVGAVQSFRQLLTNYRKIPFAPPVEADLTSHVLDGGMDGIWHYMAKEEKSIRENPVKRTTQLLQRVFGSVQ